MLPARERGCPANTAALHPIRPHSAQPNRPNAATGQCRKLNTEIPALNGSGNFATVWQVSAAFFFIVFILAFVAFVMSLLEIFVRLPSFVKGRVGLVYQSFILVAALIAVIIGGVKFQEIGKYVNVQDSVTQLTPIYTPLVKETVNGQAGGALTGNLVQCVTTPGSGSTPDYRYLADCTATGNTKLTYKPITGQSCVYFIDNADAMSYVNLCSYTSGNFNRDVMTVNSFVTSKMNAFFNVQLASWGFGLGVAVTSVVMAAFQLFVAFRHFAAESRAADTKGDGNAA